MKANKRSPAAYKAKESYLLSSLIVCGECLEKHGQKFAMMGNCRPIGRNKMKYVTYRCGNRDNKKNCDNKELRREHIENFVISALNSKIFNDDVIPQLVEQLNDYQNSLDTEVVGTKSHSTRHHQAARQHCFCSRPSLYPIAFP